MNKQRKVLITITYNEMGIIIDTKTEEVAQPEHEQNTPPEQGKSDKFGVKMGETCTDTISRKAAIDEAEEWIETYNSGRGGQRERDAIKHVISGIKKLPSAQPDVPDTNVGDMISRQSAIQAINEYLDEYSGLDEEGYHGEKWCAMAEAKMVIENLPSAQPEIIRCGQCKYAEVADSEDSQDGYTCQFHRGSIWFSGSYCSWAERRQDEL